MKNYAFLLLLLCLGCSTLAEIRDVASGELPIEDASPEAGAVVTGISELAEKAADPVNWTLPGAIGTLVTAGVGAWVYYNRKRKQNG